MIRPVPDPTAATNHDGTDPTVMVSMLNDQLVIHPPKQLDLAMTEVLVVAAASAVASGSTVMIDLDDDTASAEIYARRPRSRIVADCIAGDGGPVTVLGAGYVRLAARDAYWTIDVHHGRLCRSAEVTEPHFFGHDDWTPIQALWVSPTSVTALATDGTYLSTFATWTSAHQTAS